MEIREQQDRDKTLISDRKQIDATEENVRIIEWEDFEHELARLWSLTSALKEANERKQSLQEKLQSFIQVKTESLNRMNELEEMRERLAAREVMMENMSMRCKVVTEDAKKHEEMLSTEVRSLVVAGTSLSVARKRLQESNRILHEERGYIKLKNLLRKLRTMQQYKISQVSLLYPVKILAGPLQAQELESYPSSSKLGNSSASKSINHRTLTILGLHPTILPFTKMSFFTDKKELQKSTTALGYVAHVCCFLNCFIFTSSPTISFAPGWFPLVSYRQCTSSRGYNFGSIMEYCAFCIRKACRISTVFRRSGHNKSRLRRIPVEQGYRAAFELHRC
ncbi:uncharacterized protein LOC120213775 isoform X2 [Hibiscus syriacus]|uniref:uncharacterized protein LOC120213775 isoform X2 n=1 Tax=Hibiscus syriacus TaxID=106335 RepID=UPI00192286CB|nr:uncharacterized protein LOC120213775 isoform X2 [Hibiscus syriacus]